MRGRHIVLFGGLASAMPVWPLWRGYAASASIHVLGVALSVATVMGPRAAVSSTPLDDHTRVVHVFVPPSGRAPSSPPVSNAVIANAPGPNPGQTRVELDVRKAEDQPVVAVHGLDVDAEPFAHARRDGQRPRCVDLCPEG